MTVKGAFDQLATWTITGVTNLGLDDWAGLIPDESLPVVLPRLGGTGGEFLKPLGIAGEQGRVVVHVNHHLLISGLGMGLVNERFYGALTHIDNYLAAVVDDLLLDDNLLEPLSIVDTWAGPVDLGNFIYWGITFRHRWVIKVT